MEIIKFSSHVFSEDKSTFVTIIDPCDESVYHLPVLQIETDDVDTILNQLKVELWKYFVSRNRNI